MVLTYIGLGLLSGAAIAATWHIMTAQYRGITYEKPEGYDWFWGPPGLGKTYAAGRPYCDVCGAWTIHPTCPDCEAWAEDVAILGVRRDNIAAFIDSMTCCYEQYDGRMWPNEIEHRRLVNKVGW